MQPAATITASLAISSTIFLPNTNDSRMKKQHNTSTIKPLYTPCNSNSNKLNTTENHLLSFFWTEKTQTSSTRFLQYFAVDANAINCFRTSRFRFGDFVSIENITFFLTKLAKICDFLQFFTKILHIFKELKNWIELFKNISKSQRHYSNL